MFASCLDLAGTLQGEKPLFSVVRVLDPARLDARPKEGRQPRCSTAKKTRVGTRAGTSQHA